MDPGLGDTTSTLLSVGESSGGVDSPEEWRLLPAEESPVPSLLSLRSLSRLREEFEDLPAGPMIFSGPWR